MHCWTSIQVRHGLDKSSRSRDESSAPCGHCSNRRFLRRQLAAAHQRGRLKQYFNRAVLGPKLLVVDEIGYLPFGRDEANLFFSVIAKRHERGSMVLTSNLPFTQWATAFADFNGSCRSLESTLKSKLEPQGSR